MLSLVVLTLVNIVLQLSSAALIKTASILPSTQLLTISVLLLIAMTLAFGRFIIWGKLHKRFPVSISYPASALFFPSLVLMAYFYGEPVSFQQLVGVAIVTFSVTALVFSSSTTQRSATATANSKGSAS